MASGRSVEESHNSCTAGGDRISNLPCMLTERILECLPLHDVVKISFLSRYWRNIWAVVPQLILDKDFFEISLKRLSENELLYYFGAAYADIVNNVLYRHTGPILKFVLYLHPIFLESGDISHWIQLVFAKGVKEFTLIDRRDHNHILKLPSCFFSSRVSLTHLTLHRCQIGSIPPNFSGFPCLVSLHLEYYHCTDANSLQILISSCPQLESLSLSIIDPSEYVLIHAPKLRDLVVCGIFYSICLEGTTNLNMISLDVTFLTGMCTFWRRLPNIETLVIGDTFWQTLHEKETFTVTNEFGRLTALKVVGMPKSCHRAISFVLSFAVTSPNLQNLEIETPTDYDSDSDCCDASELKEGCTFQRLEKVALVCISGSSHDLQFIKLLLACSPVLQVMTIEVSKEVKGVEEKLNITRELLSYSRASTNAKILFKSHKSGDLCQLSISV